MFTQPRYLALEPRLKLEQRAREGCQNAYLGDSILCRVLDKYLCYADPENVDITPHLCLNGFWETWITQAMAGVLQPGWNCIDVGANMGYYTLLMADAVGAAGKVLALEPHPKFANLLDRTLKLNGFNQATAIQKAAGDADAQIAVLAVPPLLSGGSSIAPLMSGKELEARLLEVETTTLDKLVEEHNLQLVDFIKIDAEGAEEDIWQGMQNIIAANPNIKIMMEFDNGRYSNPRAFLEKISTSGFKFHVVDFNSQIQPLTIEQCLEKVGDWWMLYLERE